MKRGKPQTHEPEVEDPTIPRTEAPKAPLQVVSMKTPHAGSKQVARPERRVPAVRLQSEGAASQAPPAPVGRLAPPRDPNEVRARRVRDIVLWGSLAVMLAAGVTLAIWLLAGR